MEGRRNAEGKVKGQKPEAEVKAEVKAVFQAEAEDGMEHS